MGGGARAYRARKPLMASFLPRPASMTSCLKIMLLENLIFPQKPTFNCPSVGGGEGHSNWCLLVIFVVEPIWNKIKLLLGNA